MRYSYISIHTFLIQNPTSLLNHCTYLLRPSPKPIHCQKARISPYHKLSHTVPTRPCVAKSMSIAGQLPSSSPGWKASRGGRNQKAPRCSGARSPVVGHTPVARVSTRSPGVAGVLRKFCAAGRCGPRWGQARATLAGRLRNPPERTPCPRSRRTPSPNAIHRRRREGALRYEAALCPPVGRIVARAGLSRGPRERLFWPEHRRSPYDGLISGSKSCVEPIVYEDRLSCWRGLHGTMGGACSRDFLPRDARVPGKEDVVRMLPAVIPNLGLSRFNRVKGQLSVVLQCCLLIVLKFAVLTSVL